MSPTPRPSTRSPANRSPANRSPIAAASLAALGLLLPVQLACTGGDGGDSGLPAGTGDTGDTAASSPCGPWSSVYRTDAEWTYTLDEAWAAANNQSGSWTSVAFGQETWNSIYVYLVKEQGDYQVPGWDSYETSIQWRYVCDEEGVKLLQFEGTYKYDDELTEENGWWAGEFSEPVLLQPWDMEVGDTWSFDTTYQYTSNATSGTGMPLRASYEVVGETTVDTPAGSFQAMQVEVEWSGDARTDFESDSWTALVAPEVGLVGMQDRAWLQSYDLNPEFEF